MNVSFNGYNEGVATFEADSSVSKGTIVTMHSSGKVKAATSEFIGVCRSVRAGYAAVQLDGYAVLPYTGTLSIGIVKLVVSSGKIKADSTNGREYLVLDVDTTAGLAGIIL